MLVQSRKKHPKDESVITGNQLSMSALTVSAIPNAPLSKVILTSRNSETERVQSHEEELS